MATSLPDVTIQIQDNSLGQVPASTGGVQVKAGICSAGAVGVLQGFGDTVSLVNAMGTGPVVDATAHVLKVPGNGTTYLLPLNPSTYGTAGAVTKTSPTGAAGTVAVTLAPAQQVRLKIVLGGVNGTMTFQVSLGAGAYGAVVTSTGGTFSYAVPGTLTTVTFAAGQTWVANDVYTVATNGTVTLTGSGPAASNVTHTDSPIDAYSVLVTILTAGALGVATFSITTDSSFDAQGNQVGSVTGPILVPSSGVYVVPGTGVVLTFASTFGAGDTFSFSTTTASFNNTDLTNGLTILNASAVEWGFVHVVGPAANSAGAASAAAVVDSAMVAAEAQFRFVWGMVECPTSESDSTVAAAFANFASLRTVVAAGDAYVVSPLSGKILRRNGAWVASARIGSIPLSEEPSFVGRGQLPNVVSLVRDEAKTPLLDAARFMTLRTLVGMPGFYVTRGMTMAPAGSDFNRVSRRRVMDRACQITRAALLPYLNGSVRVDKKSGFINEVDAQTIEGDVNAKLITGIVSNSPTGDATDATCVLSRNANILSTNTEPVTVRVVPKAILEQLPVNIGFTNPVLTQQIALAA